MSHVGVTIDPSFGAAALSHAVVFRSLASRSLNTATHTTLTTATHTDQGVNRQFVLDF